MYDFVGSAARPAGQATPPGGPADKGKVLTRGQAAAMLGFKPQTLAKWACAGGNGLVFYRVGGRARYYEADVRAYMAAGMVAPVPTPAPEPADEQAPEPAAVLAAAEVGSNRPW